MHEYDSTLDAALHYASLGWFLFPVHGASNPRLAKHPVIKEVPHWHEDSTNDPKQLITWFTGTNYGIGLDCGKSGVFVLDGDRLEAVPVDLNLNPAWSLRGNPERQSWIFKQPETVVVGCSNGEWKAGEVKGDGGYVVLPPSFHEVGGNYVWLDRSGSMNPNEDVLSMLSVKASEPLPKAFFATTGEPCKVMSGLVRHYLLRMEEARQAQTGRFLTMRDGACAIASRGAEGHKGAIEGLKVLRSAYYQSYDENTPMAVLEAEWKRVLIHIEKDGVGERASIQCLGPECRSIKDFVYDNTGKGGNSPLDSFELAVKQKLEMFRITEEAKRRYANLALTEWRPVEATNIESLKQCADTKDRIEELLNIDGTCLLVAQRKTGKTTLISNVIRALLDGNALFNTYKTFPVDGNVGLYDLEMTPALLGKWLGRLNIDNQKGLRIYPARGKVTETFSKLFSDTPVFVEYLKRQELSTLIIDPLAPLLSSLGLDENYNPDIRKLFNLLREVASAAGIGEIIFSHHSGWNSTNRARGASAFEDMVDVIWRLEQDVNSSRFFSTLGRLGNHPTTPLFLDNSSGLLTLGSSVSA